MKENMNFLVILLGLCLHQAAGVTHSLKYFYTASSEVPSFPEFVVVAMVDDVQFVHYDSNSKQAVPKLDWVNKAADPQYWERETGHFLGSQQVMKVDIETLKGRFNQTGGIHTYQLMYGCSLEGDGTTRGYLQYGYDGEDFVSLDKNTLTWTPAIPQAVITKHKWEADGAEAKYWKGYLENTCIDWLKKYVGYGKETLERTVLPQVSLLQRGSSVVVCHATGFYPEGVMITWKRDGEELQDDVDVGETMPNEDGTFQKRAMLSVSPEDRVKGKYTCEVAHKSGEPITISLDEITSKNPDSDDSVPIVSVIGVIVGLLVVGIAIAGIVIWKRREKPQRDGFTQAKTDDASSDNSSNQA